MIFESELIHLSRFSAFFRVLGKGIQRGETRQEEQSRPFCGAGIEVLDEGIHFNRSAPPPTTPTDWTLRDVLSGAVAGGGLGAAVRRVSTEGHPWVRIGFRNPIAFS
jgi:hypothetical protein